ncbi:F-box/LRR-repeat protein 13 [Spatholobus suberectus]|nr:F-box/LRR-repeat protein 13 [Spatholobus suberectus]
MENGTDKVSVPKKDRISSLPEHIIHEILSRLTMLDVARTSCLSKAWKNFCVSLPYLNIDQKDFNHLPCDRFKNFMYHKVRSMSIIEERLVMHKFKLHMHNKYASEATEEIENCTRLVSKTNSIKEFDFQILHDKYCLITNYWYELFHHIYNAKTLMVLRLGGLTVIQPSNRDIKFSHLEILRLENVMVIEESVIGWFFTNCPLIREIALVKCDGLEHLNVHGNVDHLKKLEVGFCPMLESVEIRAPSLEKLVLSEIKRRRDSREDVFCMALSIDSETSENLKELTLCNSSIRGLTFTRMFSRCSNVESLVLDRCMHFFKIRIASQKLRKLVIKRCFDLLVTDIEAPNLTSFIFCHYLPQGYYDDCNIPIIQYCEEISHNQECMLDFNQVLWSKNIWISLWFDKFKDSAGQKMVIYPKNKWPYDVVVLEDWSSMAEIPLMTQISEAARRTIITTMSFVDLAYYIFGDCGKRLGKVLAISFTDKSRLYEVLKNKPKVSCEHCSYVVITKEEVNVFSSSTCWPSFSRIAATLKATSFSVSPNFQGVRELMNSKQI